ncbi:MAG: 16S rRNA (adenine(1518)-N(6)/adenine(1519)-N(6))-dimethyltransferase RsmA, partial [Coriobacteriia bacterium]|nr:16S rRNA (adenine(1518)-N(6)/adenine(1519)-N(6))-dimethyltransferase RsmA [Coriobacteriia bacterium]
PVVEIGPGIGTLTEALLASGADVLAVEVDESLKPVLSDIRDRYSQQFRYLMTDALLLLPHDLPEQFDLVANLPYSLAATIILDAFQRFAGLRSATVMVQREVAGRIMATEGSKEYGAYTVKLALLATVKGSFAVSSNSFLPPPRVESTVLRLERNAPEDSLSAESWQQARVVIDAAFATRRKTIRNSMRIALANSEWSPETIDQALAQASIDGSRRAESLSLAEFRRLVGVFSC